MRYRIGEDPAVSAYGSTGDVVTFTVYLCIVIGAILVWLGWRGKQWWLVIWNVGLVIASFVYLGYVYWPWF